MSPLRIVLNSFRFIVGALFIFSGFVKIIDPVGTAIKLREYFETFSIVIAPFFEHLAPYAMFFSILLTTLEIVLGVALILLYQKHITISLLLLMILFFTGLTYYSASCDPANEQGVSCVTDCGCFGDAIPLNPWQSFMKDLILTAMIVPLFVFRKKFKSRFDNLKGLAIVVVAAGACLLFANYNLKHLPVIDFRAYAVGNDLRAKMNDGKPGVYEYVMKKDGQTKTFQEYPTGEKAEGYEFVEMKTVKEPEMASITDFTAYDNQGNDKTNELLTGKKLYIVSHKLRGVQSDQVSAAAQLATQLEGTEIEPVLIMSAAFDKAEAFKQKYGLNIPAYTLDETVIKAMIRSNPGYMLVKDGVVKGKWHYNDRPTPEQLEKQLN